MDEESTSFKGVEYQIYQLEKAYEFLKDKKRVNRKFQRLKERVKEGNEDSSDWLEEQKEDTEDFFKKVF